MRIALKPVWNQLLQSLWLFAILAVLVVQYLGISLPGTSVAGVFQFTDSAGWLSCSFSFPQGVDWTSNWCMRRPLAFILLSPIAATAIWGAALPIFINALVAVAAAQQLINETRLFNLNPWVTFLSSGLLMAVGVFYGLSFGPEALAFALSCTAVVAILKTFATDQSRRLWPILGSFAAVGSLLIRPGNPLLTIGIITVFIVFVVSVKNYSAALVLAGGVAYLAWGLPATLRLLFGLQEAGHGSNFWATVYPLVSPEADSWPDVYRIFSESSTGVSPDTVAWGTLVQEASIEAFWRNPLYGFDSFAENILLVLNAGWLNVAIPVLPSSPQWYLLSVSSASAAIDAPSNAFWSQQQVLSMVILPISLILWAASWLTLALAVVWLFKLAKSWWAKKEAPEESSNERFKFSVPGILGTSTVLGLLALFGLVGHDEQTRHLVQSIPFALFALNPWLFSRLPRDFRPQLREPGNLLRTQGFQDFAVACLLVLAVAAPSGFQAKPSLVLMRDCDERDSIPRLFNIVGGKSRIGDPDTAWGSGWVQRAFSELEPGVLLIALHTEKAQIERFYLLSDDEALGVWDAGRQADLLVCEVSDVPAALTTLGLRGLKMATDTAE